MLMPDCLGLELSKAQNLLKDFGLCRVEEIRPFFKGQPKEALKGISMVIGQKAIEDCIILTVCQVPLEGDEHNGK